MPCTLFPLLLMWIIFKPAHVRCLERQRMVTDLLSCTDDELNDGFASKFRFLFRAHLEKCELEGTIHLDVWMVLSNVNDETPLDQQDLEASMSILKRHVKIAPHTEWHLLSCQLLTKKKS